MLQQLNIFIYFAVFAIFFFLTLKQIFSTKKDPWGIIYKGYGKLGTVGSILIFLFILFTLLWGKIFWF